MANGKINPAEVFAGTLHSSYQPRPGVYFSPLDQGTGFCPLVSSSASAGLVCWGEGQAEAYVVVPVARRVVATIGRSEVERADVTVITFWPGFRLAQLNSSKS